MKIGILTLPLHTNYGGNLQAYAMMTVLKKNGHEVMLINRRKTRYFGIQFFTISLKRVLGKYILGRKNIDIFKESREDREQKKLGIHTQKFIDKNIQPQTEGFFTSEQLMTGVAKYNFDAIIVGSDQVWRPRYTPNIEDYFLSFVTNENTRRISYAASFGTDEWTFSAEETLACKKHIQNFDAISVREDSAVRLCEDKFAVQARHVIDPTLLLNEQDYIQLLGHSSQVVETPFLLVYILDDTDQKNKVVRYIADAKGLSVKKVNSKTEDKTASLEDRIAPPTEEWIRGFYQADFIIADSFHACAFAIIFNKPFIVYGNVNRGLTRFNSLLKMFGLEGRMVTDVDQINDDIIFEEINWSAVNEILDRQRKLAWDFINEGLGL